MKRVGKLTYFEQKQDILGALQASRDMILVTEKVLKSSPELEELCMEIITYERKVTKELFTELVNLKRERNEKRLSTTQD